MGCIRFDYDHHAMDWALGCGDKAALMAFNGATRQQVRSELWRRWNCDSMPWAEFVRLARIGYRKAAADLRPHRGKGWLVRRTYDAGALSFVRAENLDRVKDAGWNWVRDLRGMPRLG